MNSKAIYGFGIRACLLCFALGSLAALLCQPAAAQEESDSSSSREIEATITAPESGAANALAGSPDIVSASDSKPVPGAQNAASQSIANGADRCDLLSGSGLLACLGDVLRDQLGIWTSPAHVHRRDLFWILPVAGAAGVALAYDNRTLAAEGSAPNMVRISNDYSNSVGSGYALGGAAVAIYAVGKITHNERARETGVVALEALADAGIFDQGLKLATNRFRPDNGTASGKFWPDGTGQGGGETELFTTNGSFPSGHTMAAWAVMHVLVDETPGHRWLHMGLYALATGVSIARVTGRNHFPSDVVVGGALGYLIGGYVYRQRSQYYKPGLKSVSITPLYSSATHTYGVGVSFVP